MPWSSQIVRRLLQPNAIIFGIALMFVVVAHVSVARWHREFGNGRIEGYPDVELFIPYTLLVAAVMLLVSKWWSYFLALIASGWVIYTLGYKGPLGVAAANDHPLFSSWVLRNWLTSTWTTQPQYLFQLALALIALGSAVVGLTCALRRKFAAA